MKYLKIVFLPLKRIFDYRNRSGRLEFWLYVLFSHFVITVTTLAIYVLAEAPSWNWVEPFAWLAFLFLTWMELANIALFVRRLHDSGHSGWWTLVPFIAAPISFLPTQIIGISSIIAIGLLPPKPEQEQNDDQHPEGRIPDDSVPHPES